MNDLLANVKRYWKALLLLNSGVIAIAATIALTSPKVWESEAQLILPDPSSNLDADLGTLGVHERFKPAQNSGFDFNQPGRHQNGACP
jgi:uncharacterized protein involved in exopolysaccharide biosynthesis